MAYVQAPFTPDIPGSIVVPAHSDNVRPGDNHPKVSVVHTPEEPADDVEVTPYYFSRQIWVPDGHGGWVQRRASTHNYADNDGDLFQMVPERYGAIANGVRGRPYPADTNPSISLNLQSRSIEIEGYARFIYRTMPRGGPQWQTTVRWVFAGYQMHGIPLDRAHVIGHYEVADNRTDPGTLDINGIVEDASRLLEKETEVPDMYLIREESSPYVFSFGPGVFYSYLHRMEDAEAVGIPTAIKVVADGTLDSYVRADKPGS